MYSLLQNKATKDKVSEIIDKYEQRNRKIHAQFRGIEHRTAKGEECRNEFAQAHSNFIIELCQLSEIQR
ncbi:hypothetical protein [Alkaliphilus sp. B6464]|uniref:hypothetical protein n=1 Tax=Alkaliphilus sp. B6464 TaxID=2731219 RepID=UPI001BABAE54|nr:hypothetical protein [Alkaliphilus sp. B6464]QUH19327.1 hypothetical protein HYG84_05090 [Alkaliphilus sp. B6464]